MFGTREQIDWDIDAIDRAGLNKEQRAVAQVLWNVRNYLRHENGAKPLKEWTIKDIIKHVGGRA